MSLKELVSRDAQAGAVTWIGLRPKRRAAMAVVQRADVTVEGLKGDHGRPGKRAITLFQTEHLAVIGAFLGQAPPDPEALRRNLHIARLNLSSLRGAKVWVGNALLQITGPCAPCSRMQETLGLGGYNALRGHGGWTADVLTTGVVHVGDPVRRA